MSRTVTALYDSRAEAESAKERLSSTVDAGRIQICDQSSSQQGSGESGIGGWLSKLFISDDDRTAYHEGISRGGYLLCAQVDSDEDADRIVNVLEQTSPVDLDERQQSWRGEGWSGTPQARDQAAGTSGRVVEEERIPIVEEQMNIGKRQVERGGARVRSYVRETPVDEQVNLREENVSIERRPVNQALSTADVNKADLLADREIVMRATGEEAVVGKEARVTEEVVVRKTEGERVQNVQDTVRHTEVDVEADGDSKRR
jgi:uncharacterized protein (TIGR02271 family)